MPNATDQIPTGVIEAALKGSGFPFQTAVSYAIGTHKGPSYNSYKIHASEYPWRNHKNEDSFLDLVAISSRFVLTIECKKTKQEKFIFLLPSSAQNTADDTHFRCLRVAHYGQEATRSFEKHKIAGRYAKVKSRPRYDPPELPGF
jgi:hypothetical protein